MTEQLTHRPYNLGWPSVGREQISQDGMFRLSHPTFCKYWLWNSWDHYTLQMHLTRYSLGHKILWVARIYELHQKAAAFYHCIRAVSIGSAMRGENIQCLLLRLLCQPGKRLCYGCCASQERINASEVPKALWIFFQALSLYFAYPGFNE